MTSTPRLRSIICPGCGRLTVAGRCGPLPTRCAQCRRYRILPARAAGRTNCSMCSAELPVVGRRGRLPLFCRPCWRKRRRCRERSRRLLLRERTALAPGREPSIDLDPLCAIGPRDGEG